MSELPKAINEAVLNIGKGEGIPCAVLSDGTRLLNITSVYKALGRSIRSKINVGNRVINYIVF